MFNNLKKAASVFAAMPLVATLAMPAVAHAIGSTVVVTPTNTQGWSTEAPADNRPGGSVSFTNEFGAPSGFGSGALKLVTVDGSSKAQYMKVDADGTSLSDINSIAYSTYRSSASTGASHLVAAINVAIDFNGPSVSGGFATLVYEPVYQTGGAAAIHEDEWQDWDAGNNSTWWSTKNLNGGITAFTSYKSLQYIKDNNPNATVLYYGVNQGSGNPGLVSGVDKFTFGDTTYNFETLSVPTDKTDCFNNGWKAFNTPSFKNQGDCVSFVATTKKSTYKLDSASVGGLNIPTTKGWYYEVTVKGTWANRPGELVDAECTNWQNQGWKNEVNGGYSPDELDVQVNKQFVDWGTCDAANNRYTKWVIGDGSPLNLRVFDGDPTTNDQYDEFGWYADNVGTLDVTVVSHKN